MREGTKRGAMDQNVCGCTLSVYSEIKSIREESDRQIKKIDLRFPYLQGEHDGGVLIVQMVEESLEPVILNARL